MLKVIIIDDEKNARESLTSLINLLDLNIKIVGYADGVHSGVELLGKTSPDILFLDVEMLDGTGFNLLEKLNQIDFDVVFVTAYDKYALKAFQFNAANYLLKPVDLNKLESVLSRIIQNKQDKRENINLNNLIESYNANKFNKIIVNTTDTIEVIKIDDIVYIESDAHYSKIHLSSNKVVTTTKILKEFQELLVESNFFRIHRFYLINLNKLTKYIKGEGGYVILEGNIKLEVSRRNKKDLLNTISNQPLM